MLSFKVVFLIVVIGIFTTFAIAAHKADMVVGRKAKEDRELQAAKIGSTNKKKK